MFDLDREVWSRYCPTKSNLHYTPKNQNLIPNLPITMTPIHETETLTSIVFPRQQTVNKLLVNSTKHEHWSGLGLGKSETPKTKKTTRPILDTTTISPWSNTNTERYRKRDEKEVFFRPVVPTTCRIISESKP